MDKFKSMQVFRAIVEQGSFKDASDYLYISKPMISKYLSFLEDTLQAKLLYRNNRQQTLTEVGKKYYLECCYILDAAQTAEREVRQGTTQPQGMIKLSIPVWFGNRFFVKLLSEFNATYPKIDFDLVLSNEFVDLVSGGFDIALRATHRGLPEHFIAKPLAKVPLNYVASPAYLQRHGHPQTKAELAQHCGLFPGYAKIDNTQLPVTHRSNNTMILYEMAKVGMGVAILPDWLTKESVAKGELIELFPLYDEPTTLYAAYIDRTFLSVKVRLFLDFLSAKWGEEFK